MTNTHIMFISQNRLKVVQNKKENVLTLKLKVIGLGLALEDKRKM